MTKFNSQTANVESQVRNTFRKAEVRLHRVQHANLPSAVLRIYLNDDSACHKTKMQDNQHFAAELHTFHGTCHGGPGHCNLPLDKTRHFDRRTLNHNEPRNYRVDVTDTVNRMLAKGESDISVHIVVVGLDGDPLENALYLDGVSLNFMD
jgi:tyrosinase